MGDGSKYLEGNYSKTNLFRALKEHSEDLKQSQELENDEEYMTAILQYLKDKREEHHYLVDGAVLRCTCCTMDPQQPLEKWFEAPEGSDEVVLKVTQNKSMVNGAGQYFATIKDSKKFDNIQPFGNCKNPPDREEEEEKIMMAEESEELRKLGTCVCLMQLNDAWENMISAVGYEEIPGEDGRQIETVTMESILFCKHGGFIYPVNSGYIMTDANDQYIKNILEALGWPIDDEELQELSEILKHFEIEDKNSIACFLLICRSEAGAVGLYSGVSDREGKPITDQYGRAIVEYYPLGYKKEYTYKERGVGYINVTGKEDQYACLDYLQKNGYYNGAIDNNADGYVEELKGNPWAVSAWRWSVYTQTSEGLSLNEYVVDRTQNKGDYLSKEVYLAAESFVNGIVKNETAIILTQIVNNEIVDWKVDNGKLIVNGKNYLAPNNWDKFEDNYNTLIDAGLIEGEKF